MEIIQNQQIQNKRVPALPMLSENLLNYCKWKEPEIIAYQVMNNGIGLRFLEESKQYIFLLGTMIKISVISGCPIPTDVEHKKILRNEMKKFLMENYSYSIMTSEEIATAFRFNSAGTLNEKIEHWQNIFNLDYLGKVLEQWQILKRKVQFKADVEQMRLNLYEPRIAPKQPVNEVLDHAKDIWNKTNDFLFIPSIAYDYLKKEKKYSLSESRKKEIREIATCRLEKLAATHPYHELLMGLIYSDQYDIIKSKVAKKIALSEFFQENERQLPIPKQSDEFTTNL